MPDARISTNGAAATKPTRSPGELAELIGAFNDVTSRLQETHERLTAEVARLQSELHDTNRRLRRAQELAALGEMAAGIAHEIRNPLGSIRLYASALEQDLADRPDQRRLAGRIADAVRGLNAIVCDVLAFAREVKIEAVPARAASIIERAAAACADLIERTGVELALPGAITADDADAMILCDAGLVQQALTNIIRNAIEAVDGAERRDKSGRVSVSVQRATQRDETGAAYDMISLRVRDTGPGVTPEVMQRMFNPFFTTRDAGAGLGLAIVHRIADAHGGRVSVRNHESGGAEFELLIPAADQSTQTKHQADRTADHRMEAAR